MASVFTYDPEPPRISSPWATPPISTPEVVPSAVERGSGLPAGRRLGGLLTAPPVLLAECGISKLQPEPQEGPTEYKLHLLLRPRRKFSASSTRASASGSHLSRPRAPRVDIAATERHESLSSSDAVPTHQSRQNRLQHLTTQLLWRLQQSSPHHSFSTAGLVVPLLPSDDADVALPTRPERLMPGLEESGGALYEIGVADDGSLVGLTEDELSESLTNLKAMAASLGCKIEILRTVIVGDCEWYETVGAVSESVERMHKDALWVAEVLVVPETAGSSTELVPTIPLSCNGVATESSRGTGTSALVERPKTEQIRVSLTGSTTSGKSSLLGTLLTSTLDNGRGKVRLSLLKHRHEIASGVTSSVAPELIGYSFHYNSNGRSPLGIITYACGNVSTWNDIHNEAEGGRLVFLTDSAGHPRYRRTTVRGLVSWAPHWTLCCIAADQGVRSHAENASREEHLEQDPVASLSKAHLELCLKLGLPLVVVITKQDLATRLVLRQTLSSVLSAVKAAGRKPVMMMKPSPTLGVAASSSISSIDELEVQMAFQEDNIVPILLTSAVTGSGIGKLHALLRHLPLPICNRAAQRKVADVLFHVDEVFLKPPKVRIRTGQTNQEDLVVVSGYLRYGTIAVGDILSVGPFTPEPNDELKSFKMRRTYSSPGGGSNASYAARLSQSIPQGEEPFDSTPPVFPSTPLPFHGEFLCAKVVSLRNLRLPKHHLFVDQVGTIGLELGRADALAALKIRKGMVLARPSSWSLQRGGLSLTACTAFKARFNVDDYHVMEPGATFNLYVASVRATGKIVTVEIAPRDEHAEASSATWNRDQRAMSSSPSTGDGGGAAAPDIFRLDDFSYKRQPLMPPLMVPGGVVEEESKDMIDVVFQLLNYREWFEIGAQVLVMPGSALEGGVGLDGFAGKVTDLFN